MNVESLNPAREEWVHLDRRSVWSHWVRKLSARRDELGPGVFHEFCGKQCLFLLRHVGQSGLEKRRDVGVRMLFISDVAQLASMELRISGRDRGIDKYWPRIGAVTGFHEDFVKEFDSRVGHVSVGRRTA